MMPNLGGGELLIVAAVVMLLFGAKKLPEFARSLGKAKGEFKKGLDDEESTPAVTKAQESDPKA
jgi:sec-independent protein translocase protein TatA